MWPWALNIHFGGPCSTIFLSFFEEHKAFILVLNDVLTEPLDVNALKFVLSYLQWVFLVRILQQVKKFFIVYLYETAVNWHFYLVVCYPVEEISDASRNYASVLRVVYFSQSGHRVRFLAQKSIDVLHSWPLGLFIKDFAKHGVCFARARLTIGKDGAIKPIDNIFYAILHVVKHLHLIRFLPENFIILCSEMVGHVCEI